MKRVLSLFLSGLCLLSFAVGFDPGGECWDFAALSRERFAGVDPGTIMFQDAEGWEGGTMWMHLADAAKGARLRPLLVPQVRFVRGSDSRRGPLLRTEKPLSLERTAGGDAASFSASWTRTFRFIPGEAGAWNLAFDYRYSDPGAHPSRGYLVCRFALQDGGERLTVDGIPLRPGRWAGFSHDLARPDDAVSVEFMLRLDGCGTIEFTAPRFCRRKHAYPAQVVLTPGGLTDNVFALSQGDPAVLAFSWRRLVPRGQWRAREPRLHVILPGEIRLLECTFPLQLLGRKGQEHVFSLDKVRDRPLRLDGFDDYLLLPLVITTSAAPGAPLAAGSYWLTDGDALLSARSVLGFKVIPRIPAAGRSSRFLNGIQPMGRYLDAAGPETREMLAEFVGRCGMRWFAGDASPEMQRLYRRHGILHITPELYWLANGFRIGPPEGKPDYARYRSLGNSASPDVRNATCPAAVYRRTPYFQDVVVPYLRKSLQGADGAIANWEPFMFKGMGCFCDNCRAEFARFAGISEEEARAVWPQELRINRKYHRLGVRFRSWQHARMVAVLQEEILRCGTGKVGFVPEVAWLQMTGSPRRLEHCEEFDPLDYAGGLKWIDPWGPYLFWDAREPYSYEKAPGLHSYTAARKVVEFTRRSFPAERRPRLMALPHGLQNGFWVTTPEALAMEVLGFFVAGYDASTIYLFPKGYDNRFWAAQARVNDRIARYEDRVCVGTRIPAAAAPASPYPAARKRLNSAYFNDLEAELLQVAAFRQGDGVLVAAGNYWTKGEVFFRLRIPGLPADGRYRILDADQRHSYVDRTGGRFTGAAISRGVLLHAGALRWAFLEVVPDRGAPSGLEIVRADAVEEALRKRLPAIRAAAEREAELDRAEERRFRKSELREMRLGRLECRPGNDPDGSQIISLAAGGNSVRIGLKGLSVQSWRTDGTEIVAGNTCGGLGSPAFWNPPVLVEQPFLVDRQERTPDGCLLIEGERELTDQDSAPLNHLRIRQALVFSESLDRIVVRTSLVNGNDSETGGAPVTAGFRYHLLPRFLGFGGRIEFTRQGRKVTFVRRNRREVFACRMNDATAALRKLFEAPDDPVPVDGAESLWISADGKVKVRSSLAPADRLAGYAVWDTPDLSVPTLEPYFDPVTIPARKSADFELTLQLVR